MDYDVIILGGGVNGTGTARDCAMRGLRVLLLEKADFGVGASGNSSGMIHGGIRYMLSDRHVTALACRDSGYIQRIAPHLLFRIPFLMPFTSRAEGATLRDRAAWYATEVYVGTYDLFQPLKHGKPSTRLSAEELYRLEPGLRPGLRGAVTLDEWGIDAFRLCALNALSARAHGAELRTWTAGREILAEGGRVRGVRFRDALTGEEGEARAPVVFNATGAWSPALARRSGAAVPMRPGKGVHLTLDRRYSNYGVILSAVDGRQMFVMPHEDESIVGTTDDDYYGDPDDVEATNDEVEYLVEGAASLLPGVRNARITRAWCGLRTTIYAYGPNEDALSREHQLHDGAAFGRAGLLSLVGGKLASYRAQSQEVTDRILALLGRAPVPCRTHEEPLPGGDEVPDPAALARAHPVAAPIAARLVYRHGGRAREILRLLEEDPRLGLVLCRDEGILAAEVVHCVRHEQVRRLQDLRRRCRLAVGACAGLDCARVAAQLAGRELGWSPEQ
ncbi:glycerol-3-phosphate dehydrogenase/oxidase, partial [Anaeromyxobacter sp. SG26]